jgi:hypothetical protein
MAAFSLFIYKSQDKSKEIVVVLSTTTISLDLSQTCIAEITPFRAVGH